MHCSAISICLLSMGGMPFVCDARANRSQVALGPIDLNGTRAMALGPTEAEWR